MIYILSTRKGKTLNLSHREFRLLQQAQAPRTTHASQNNMPAEDRAELNGLLKHLKGWR